MRIYKCRVKLFGKISRCDEKFAILNKIARKKKRKKNTANLCAYRRRKPTQLPIDILSFVVANIFYRQMALYGGLRNFDYGTDIICAFRNE